jgi:hypothetical protein
MPSLHAEKRDKVAASHEAPLNPHPYHIGQNCREGLGAGSEEKHEPVSDIDTAAADGLKVLDPNRPIREADTEHPARWLQKLSRLRLIVGSLADSLACRIRC